MYLKKLRLQNIKCFEDVTLEFPHRDGDYSGWNVILGTNGQGKTTILRGAAVGTLNPLMGFFGLQYTGSHYRRDGHDGPGKV
ncbi:MAG TPA: AAA family ATPase, partial [Urbifossiella sp.]|nr:AAA family ATPase [Urbifossiella sp.]